MLGITYGRKQKMSLRAGTGQMDVTPRFGTPMAGYWYLRRMSGVLDPLYLKAVVLEEGGSMAAIVTADVCYFPASWIEDAVALIEERTGISRDGIFVTASHTHTGPVTERMIPGLTAPPEYQAFFNQRLADVVEQARQQLEPVRAAVGESSVPGIAFNRRLLGADGKVTTYKPDETRSAEELRPAGPVDDTARVLQLVKESSGEPTALLVNFALHPDTISGTLASADFPGVMSRTLSGMTEGEPEVLFLNGPAGDINHLNPTNPGNVYEADNARRIGQILAAGAYRATREPVWIEGENLRTGRLEVELAVRNADEASLQTARSTVSEHSGELTKEVSRAQDLLKTAERAGESFTTEVSGIAIGNLALLGLPGEIFAALGLEARNGSPFDHTLIAELTNDYAGYIMPEEGFEQGGYETLLRPGSFAEASAGSKLTSAGSRLLAKLRNA